MNIDGRGIKKINTVIEFIILDYININDGQVCETFRLVPGEKLKIPKSKVNSLPGYIEGNYFLNPKNDLDIAVSEDDFAPSIDKQYTVDLVNVKVSKKYASIEFDPAVHKIVETIEIISNKDLFFQIEPLLSGYTFSLLITNKKTNKGLITYTCSFKIYGMYSFPGQTYDFTQKLFIYSDPDCTNLIGESLINLRVHHQTSGNED